MKIKFLFPLLVVALLLSFAALTPSARTQQRGLGTGQETPAANAGRYYALVIGNNAYTGLPKLKTAETDAREVAALLKEFYGFETNLLLNATRGKIVSALSSYRRSLGPDANLLIYYAGHGVNDADKAYWLPVDAERDDTANWIIADEITQTLKVIPARHVLVVSDSCYSGTLTRGLGESLPRASEREQFLQRMAAGRSRTLMASGGDEPVADGGGDGRHSVFANALLRGLQVMDKAQFTGAELFRYHVEESVAGRANQTPEYNPLKNSGHESGDFIFIRIKTDGKSVEVTVNTQPSSASPVDSAVIELSFWDSIKGSIDPEDFRAYLQQYPDGKFVLLARNRLNILTQPAKPAEPKELSPNSTRSYGDLITRAKEAVILNNYEEATRLFNEAATVDEDNPEPYEQLGKLYWEKAYNADGSGLTKAEQAYVETIKRGGKAVFRTYRHRRSGFTEMIITITATKSIFAEKKGEYTYETDYDGLTFDIIDEKHRPVFRVFYPEETGKYFKPTGNGKPDTTNLTFFWFVNEGGKSMYPEKYKASDVERLNNMRYHAVVTVMKAAQQLSAQTK